MGIDSHILIDFFTVMTRIRKVQLRIEQLYAQDEMKTPVHLCIGQEAIAAAVCLNLNSDDYVFSNHRGHGHYIAKGGDLCAMIAELYCKQTGCSRGRGGSMHLIDTSVGLMGSSSIVGGSIALAVGAALSCFLRQERGRVSVTFFGDAASEEGVLYESMNFAALKKLPVVFVCENNFYSVYSHQDSRQANLDICSRARVFRIPAFKVDGRDALDAYRKSRRAISLARHGSGPVFIECRACRYRGHAGPGDPLMARYRHLDQHREWMDRCPIKEFERFLFGLNILTPEKLADINSRIDSEIDQAFTFARRSPLPSPSELENYVYA